MESSSGDLRAKSSSRVTNRKSSREGQASAGSIKTPRHDKRRLLPRALQEEEPAGRGVEAARQRGREGGASGVGGGRASGGRRRAPPKSTRRAGLRGSPPPTWWPKARDVIRMRTGHRGALFLCGRRCRGQTLAGLRRRSAHSLTGRPAPSSTCLSYGSLRHPTIYGFMNKRFRAACVHLLLLRPGAGRHAGRAGAPAEGSAFREVGGEQRTVEGSREASAGGHGLQGSRCAARRSWDLA
ncbi:unnamed protein product [Arctogadus glacialis]